MDQHGEGVVAFAHVRGIDLAGVTGEYHLGAFANAGEDGLEGRRLQVLGFIHHHKLALQRATAQERDRLQGQLAAIREVFNQAARVTT